MLLENMKKGVGKYIMIFLASLLILSFAVWGIGDMAGLTSTSTEVASIGKTSITRSDFRVRFQREMDQLRRQIGDIDSQQARSLGIADSTLNGLIAERLLELQASEFGLLISDDLVRRKIRQEQAFQNKAGQFDSGLYKTMQDSYDQSNANIQILVEFVSLFYSNIGW